MTSLEEVAAELYRLPPSEFTGRRNALAKDLRDEDRALADQVARLPKPAVSAWAVDVFAHESPDELADLLDLGTQLREAQQSLSADRMKSLTAQAHSVVQRVVSDVARVAREAGSALSDSMLGPVEQTLRAAMADEDAANAVRAGLLAKPLEAGGFGPVDLAGAVVGTPRPAPPRQRKRRAGDDAPDETADRERRRHAEQAAEEATARLRDAQSELAHQHDEVEAVERERQLTAERLAELRDELRQTEEQHAAAASRARTASRAEEKAEKRVRAAQQAAEKAQKALDELVTGG